MTKSIKELKKENSFLKSKCEKSDVTLIELLDEVNLHLLQFYYTFLWQHQTVMSSLENSSLFLLSKIF